MTSRKTSTNGSSIVRRSAGFSLIELMIIIALIAIIAGFSMTLSTSAIIRANASDERDFLVALLTESRARALSNVDESAHGVFIDTINRTFLVYERRGGCTRATTSVIEIPFVSSAEIGGTKDRCFAPLSLRVSAGNAGTTTIALGGSTTTVNVNSVGRIDW